MVHDSFGQTYIAVSSKSSLSFSHIYVVNLRLVTSVRWRWKRRLQNINGIPPIPLVAYHLKGENNNLLIKS